MESWISRLKRAAVLTAALVLVGCASLPQPGTRLDLDALGNAIVADHATYVKAAVDARLIDVNARIPAPVYMEGTPLITIAARAGAVEVVRYLIAARADLNALTPAYETALMLATYFPTEPGSASGRHEQVARMLIEAGAMVDNHAHSYTPLAYAAFQGRDRMIQYLLKSGARVDASAGRGVTYVNTPLMMAAMQGHTTSAVLLLRAGADARVRVVNGHTAAELAAKYNGGSLVPLLRCAETVGSAEVFVQRCERSARN